MLASRLDQEKWEETHLASYGMKAAYSAGRTHKEEADLFRTDFQRDRDRIIHCAAFRRLEYKTQVFTFQLKNQHCRSRLTHTLEVGQVARTISRALYLNEDLSEAIAMAHDIGHPPFGHVGQKILNQLMKDFGGFEHNKQAFRIVELLEHRYPNFPGINLTEEVTQSLLKHSSSKKQLLLEAQVVDLSDSIAYDCHDTEDSLAMGMITEKELMDIALWKESYEEVSQNINPQNNKELFHKFVLKHIINKLVKDAIEQTLKNIQDSGKKTPQDFTELPEKCACHSEQVAQKKQELHQLLFENVFHHYKMHQIAAKVEHFTVALFKSFQKNPKQLPDLAQTWIKRDGVERAICDFIACYTDRELQAEYQRLFLPD